MGVFFVNSLYVQIDIISDLSLRCIAPVDTCPAFAVKRRSFLFVMDIPRPLRFAKVFFRNHFSN